MVKIDKIAAGDSIASASWPQDAPNRDEKRIISIVCGNTHLHWAVHEGQGHDFVPILFWRYVNEVIGGIGFIWMDGYGYYDY
jgi:hypothetical protein